MALGKVIKSDAAPSGEQNRPRGVMNAEEVEARGQAREILQAAHHKAQEIIAEAHAKAQRVESEAQAKGREEGLSKVTEELARAKMQAGEMLKAAEQDIVSLSLILAEKIIGRDLERDPEVLLQMCATATEHLRNSKQMTLRVNPENGAMLRAKLKGLMDLVARSVDISIKDDSEVEPAGCIVQTEFGTIDAQLHTQLAMLRELLVSDTAKKEGPA
ncbi:MAG: FliH/SctL family protein [Myxococcota bacterium]|nr:FliH/SctL family protein [Myxococcota bacterium]